MSSEPRACEHMTLAVLGARNESMSGRAFAAPGRTCPCCRGWYFYVDSGWMSLGADGKTSEYGGRTHTDNCDDCGGGYVEYGPKR